MVAELAKAVFGGGTGTGEDVVEDVRPIGSVLGDVDLVVPGDADEVGVGSADGCGGTLPTHVDPVSCGG